MEIFTLTLCQKRFSHSVGKASFSFVFVDLKFLSENFWNSIDPTRWTCPIWWFFWTLRLVCRSWKQLAECQLKVQGSVWSFTTKIVRSIDGYRTIESWAAWTRWANRSSLSFWPMTSTGESKGCASISKASFESVGLMTKLVNCMWKPENLQTWSIWSPRRCDRISTCRKIQFESLDDGFAFLKELDMGRQSFLEKYLNLSVSNAL